MRELVLLIWEVLHLTHRKSTKTSRSMTCSRSHVTIVMDRRNFEKTLTLFQACIRGYLVREELRRARTLFEDVVKEIDGSLAHLEWRDTIISAPHFTDTDGPLHRTSKTEGPDVSASLQNPEGADAGMHCALLQNLEEEKDAQGSDKQTRECLESSPAPEAGQNVIRDKVLKSTQDSTSIRRSMSLESHPPHKGRLRYRSAKEVPPNPEALRFHRDALTMELLWLQQAIDSRKKYLSLKDKLSMTEAGPHCKRRIK
ncbi:IQ domain-containing protein C isoform X1 [Entelurus aequoreus]|uniref:IQ domain-containing protein C isoform X1 n=2 Tax=Entelurus aequoreus TaxID=161455 RepID=UPI002B1DD2AB|nr:IQ domain-containing protein C isoform X1 [Entelurus aequoreus]